MIDKLRLIRTLQSVLVCALAVLACLLLYRFDNKYTAPGSRGMNGVLLLSEADAQRCTFLIEDWAVYGGVLLTPDDFLYGEPEPDEYAFIGQYGGFEKLTGSPHGSVTYRLVIGIPEETRSYTLALPEIFSSCRVYVNGTERLALGETDPDSYRFETWSADITFDATGKIDLLIAVSDFTHLYSGMVYPPAIGSPDTVSHMRYTHLFLRCAVLAAALFIGIISLFIGLLSGRKGTSALYGLLCLLFVGYTCYPVTMALTRGSPTLYMIENVSFCTMLLVVLAMQTEICRDTGWTQKARPYVLGFGVLVCLAAIIAPFILPRTGLPPMMAYSYLITVYQWLTAGYITVTAGISVWKKTTGTAPLFFGMLVLDCTLLMDRVLHSFEPILSGWFPEIGSFVLVVSLGVVSAREVVRSYRENAVMEERVSVIISSGREHYQKMNEMYDTLRILRHDYKYHLSIVGEALRSGNADTIDKISNYLQGVETGLSESELTVYCKNSVINALLVSYAERCAKLSIQYEVKMSASETDSIPDYEMCIILGNLLENAVEACQKKESGRKVKLVVKRQGEHIAIMVKNTFDGKIAENSGQPVSLKKDGGYGLRSIETVASRYEGFIHTKWDDETFTASLLLRI